MLETNLYRQNSSFREETGTIKSSVRSGRTESEKELSHIVASAAVHCARALRSKREGCLSALD
jgi:vacuolar-type H+-ATPase subunit E/Vma4